MANNEAGAFLNITPDVLNKLDSFDKKLENIQNHAKTAADALKSGFSSLNTSTSTLSLTISALAQQIEKLSSAGLSVKNIGEYAQGSAKGVSSMNVSLSRAAQLLNQVNGINTNKGNSIQQQISDISRLDIEIKKLRDNTIQYQQVIDSYLSKANTTGISTTKGERAEYKIAKEYLSDLNAQISALQSRRDVMAQSLNVEIRRVKVSKDATAQMSLASEAERRNYRATMDAMSKYYSELEKSSARAAKQAEKDAERKAKADERAAQRAAKATEQAKRAQELAMRNTPQGALQFSASAAKSVEQQRLAVQYLTKALNGLDRNEIANHATILSLNSALAQHTTWLRQAGAQSQQLSQHHRSLWNVAEQLKRQFALMFSVSQIEGYVKKIAEVRGEFELQQRSLQAILQNKQKADEIYNQTLDLALRSPFRAKQLLTFTKQLAAYRVESDKLFDTTKRLSDVSAGLGVDMQRLILAYGQVKAAAYLRGTEVRQFTEAGINLYGELQSYFQEVKGEAYTTAQIVDMISKRKVTFEDIEAIFKRLTDEGGLFYNMQEIQAQTLQGKIGILNDAFDRMYNDIGKANEGILKGSLDAVTALARNWETLAAVLKAAAGAFLYIKTSSFLANAEITKSIALTVTYQRHLGATKWQAFFLGMQKGWQMIAKGALSSIGMITKALKGAAWFALLDATLSFFQNTENHAKRIREITEEQYKQNAAIATLVKKYNELKDAAKNLTTKKQKDSNFEEKKKQLAELYTMFGKQGLEIPVSLDKITQQNIDEVFNDSQQKLKTINNIVADASRKIESDKANIEIFGFTPFSESIIENTEEYADALDGLLGNTSAIENAANIAAANYDKLNARAKKYYDEVRSLSKQHSKEEISNAEYVIKTYEALENMRFAQAKGSWFEQGFMTKIRTGLNGIRNGINSYNTELAAAQRSWGKLLNSVNNANNIIAKYNEGKITAKDFEIIINKIATENNFSTGSTIAFKAFSETWANEMGAKGLKFEINKKNGEEELDGLDKIFRKWFAEHKYNLNISYDIIGDKDIGKDFIEQGDDAAKAWKEATKVVQRLNKSKNATFNQKQSGLSAEQWKSAFGTLVESVTKEQLIKYYEEFAKANLEAAHDAGWVDDKAAKKAAKAERDIWQERIDTLEKMQARYEQLKKHTGDPTAQSSTRSAFADSISYTGLDKIIKPEDIVPTKQGLIDALNKVLNNADFQKTAGVKKINDLKQKIAELKIGIQQDYLKEQLDKTKQNIEDMFNGLDLHQKLKDAGLSEAEVQQLFPGLARTLDDVEKGIKESFDKLRDANGLLGKDEQKDYEEALNKLDQQRIKEQQNKVIELTKAYKTKLTEQMQLDTWYINERAKIYSKAYNKDTKTWENLLTSEMQKQYSENLEREYQKRTSENTWKNFQGTDYYIDMFENLDSTSTAAISRMIERLDGLRTSLNNLPADQVRAIVNQMEKLQETLISRNPFKTYAESTKDYENALRNLKEVGADGNLTDKGISYDELEESHGRNAEELANIEAKRNAENIVLQTLKQQLDNGERYGTLSKEELDRLRTKIADQQKVTDELITQAEIQGKITAAEASQLRNARNLGNTSKKSAKDIVEGVGNTLSTIGSQLPQIAGNLESVFGSMSGGLSDVIDKVSGVANGLGTAAGGITQLMTAGGNPFQMISGGISVISGLTGAIGSMLNNDKALQREIEEHQRNIENLKRAYDELKTSMDNAFTMDALLKADKELEKNLKLQNENLKSMIAAERDKKKTDDDVIRDWEKQIKDNNKLLEELKETKVEALGGFGSDSNIKSAAENFADAWLEAFKETGDGIDALKGTFDSFIENVIKKQLLLRYFGKLLEPVLNSIDAMFDPNSPGGENVLKEELDGIKQKYGDDFWEKLNEGAKDFVDYIGGLPSGTDSNLTALQQGIQGVTENTAEALESILNSMRFYLATQQSDVAAIRGILDTRLNTSSITENSDRDMSTPIITELKVQTEILKRLNNSFDSVLTYSEQNKGRGMRVYIQ